MWTAGARSSRRRAAIRERVSWTAAAGRAVVASNADSGNNIRMASVVGATAGASPIPATTAPSTLTPIGGGGHRLGERGRSGGGVQRVAPMQLAALRFGDDVGQRAGDPKLGRVFEGEHRRGVPIGMMLPGNSS